MIGATLRQARLVLARELVVERAGRETVATVVPFVAALLLLAGLAFGPGRSVLTAIAPGMVWLAVLVAAVPLARGVVAVERDEDAWDLLRALARPMAIFAGKLVALWLWLLLCWFVASVLASVLLAAALHPAAVAAGLAGTLGVATTTVVLGAALPFGRRSALLSVLMLPCAVPVLLAGAQISAPSGSVWPWLALLLGYDALGLITAWAVFPALLEE